MIVTTTSPIRALERAVLSQFPAPSLVRFETVSTPRVSCWSSTPETCNAGDFLYAGCISDEATEGSRERFGTKYHTSIVEDGGYVEVGVEDADPTPEMEHYLRSFVPDVPLELVRGPRTGVAD